MRNDPKMLGASGFARTELDAYFTLDAHMCIDALLDAYPLPRETIILEPAAGRGHLVAELRDRAFKVVACDLADHANPLIDDIKSDHDIFNIEDLAPYDAIITNLPYDTQDKLLGHLLPIAARSNTFVATLTRAAWHIAARRSDLVHNNKNFSGVVHLPRRPWWSDDRTSSPRHDFVWNVWAAQPRVTDRPAIHYPRRAA